MDFVKPQIKVYDYNFAHASSCSNGDLGIKPQYFDWYRGPETRDIEIFVDSQHTQVGTSNAIIKIWMLLEPPSVSGHLYQLAKSNISQFDYVLTFDKSLLPLSPKFIYFPNGGCWIKPEERIIWSKTKDISIIASEKNYTTGHKLRHELVKRAGIAVDVYGRGYKFVPNKLDALKDYRFSVIIENCQVDGYFTEKLIDCFMTGTIPIYWGSKSIGDIFPGIMTFNTVDEFMHIISRNTGTGAEIYGYRGHDIAVNYVKAQEFVNTEDWLWLNFLKNLCTTTPQI